MGWHEERKSKARKEVASDHTATERPAYDIPAAETLLPASAQRSVDLYESFELIQLCLGQT
jgi:hypothetical protein